MKKIFIKSLNQLIEFDLPFKKLKFNSKNNYRQLAFNINDEIVFSINNEIFDISKFGLIIQNPFCISLNEKKLLNSLYKELEEKITNSSIVKLNEIEKESFEMLNNLLNDVDYPFEYEEKRSRFIASAAFALRPFNLQSRVAGGFVEYLFLVD